MHGMNLKGADLNLLVLVDVLLRERSTTKAANVLHMSQPAVSHALGRARRLFGDPLLVRSGSRMVPTERALSLAEEITSLLRQVETMLEQRPFDPATAVGNLRITATEGATMAVLTDALADMPTAAPSITIDVGDDMTDSSEALRSGRSAMHLDVVVGGVHADLRVLDLFDDELVCLRRCADGGQRTRRKRTITVTEYRAALHVAVLGGTNTLIERMLNERGLRRSTAISVPGFVSAANIAARSDLLLTVPARLASTAVTLFPLEWTELPVGLPPVTLSLVWHLRRDSDPLHRWLRDKIVESARRDSGSLPLSRSD
ncbi:LysR family transcriptional regulator [Streptomyces sp. NPDC090075]|uniref:LysR family transcriptional regulator n=1 Tax=Streptomyces sp. NPDC090075 TaxID=3365937 RepID=UPI0037FF8F69